MPKTTPLPSYFTAECYEAVSQQRACLQSRCLATAVPAGFTIEQKYQKTKGAKTAIAEIVFNMQDFSRGRLLKVHMTRI
jgi:hypothetical protein